MIAADVIRGVLILGLLFVRRAEDVWIAYVVMALAMSGTAFFEPARTATIPNITTAEELLPANALAAATWSAMLAVGASIGGLVTAVAGRNIAFTINAASFFVSAFFLALTRYDATPANAKRRGGLLALPGITDLIDGFRYIRGEPNVAALLCVKAGWGLAGGVLLLLTIFGQRIFPFGSGAAAGIGILYGARGVGAVSTDHAALIVGQQLRKLRRTIGPRSSWSASSTSRSPVRRHSPSRRSASCARTSRRIAAVGVQHALQLEVPDRFRGRVFAVELALVTLVTSASSYWTGYELDRVGRSPRMLSFVLGAMFCVPGALWLAIQTRWHEREPAGTAEPTPTPEEEILEGRIG